MRRDELEKQLEAELVRAGDVSLSVKATVPVLFTVVACLQAAQRLPEIPERVARVAGDYGDMVTAEIGRKSAFLGETLGRGWGEGRGYDAPLQAKAAVSLVEPTWNYREIRPEDEPEKVIPIHWLAFGPWKVEIIVDENGRCFVEAVLSCDGEEAIGEADHLGQAKVVAYLWMSNKLIELSDALGVPPPGVSL